MFLRGELMSSGQAGDGPRVSPARPAACLKYGLLLLSVYICATEYGHDSAIGERTTFNIDKLRIWNMDTVINPIEEQRITVESCYQLWITYDNAAEIVR